MKERKFIRIKSDFNVWYQTIDEEKISFGKPASKNISGSGVLLESDEPGQIGTFLLLKFEVPNYNKKIEAKGKVVWTKKLESQKYGLGIEFIDISEEDMQAINSLED